MSHLDPGRVDQLLARAQKLRVVVVGDLMLDIYLDGKVERISPEAPVPVVRVEDERTALGGAGNVAANVLRFGADCEVIGVVGHDSAGERIRQTLLTLEGGTARASFLGLPDRPTTTKTRVMARRHQVVRYDREVDHDLDPETGERICQMIVTALADADVLILEDYNKGVLTRPVIRCAIDFATRASIPIVVDPKFRNVFEYQGSTVFKPNASELRSALGNGSPALDTGELEDARRRFGCEHLLVTLGEEGMAVQSADGTHFRIPALAREVYDVSGAGDTVTATIAVALGAGADIREAAALANLAAAIEVGKPGVATVHPQELRDLAFLTSDAGSLLTLKG